MRPRILGATPIVLRTHIKSHLSSKMKVDGFLLSGKAYLYRRLFKKRLVTKNVVGLIFLNDNDLTINKHFLSNNCFHIVNACCGR